MCYGEEKIGELGNWETKGGRRNGSLVLKALNRLILDWGVAGRENWGG